ncbi:potassium channel family protein [Pseudomonas sp. MBLB4136]|uniref:potassium channel family protein n=1 Tax=Pseudomonas sp. MBLB4136 TaxID=3451558 RepID=UPI003F74E039
MNIRERIFLEVDATARSHGISRFNRFICVLIVGAVLVAIFETEQSVAETYHQMFRAVEWVLFGIFLIEYCLRVYVAPMNSLFSGKYGRFKYIFSVWSVLDLFALLPLLLTAYDGSAFYLRLIRLLRILRASKLGRFTKAWILLWQAISKRRYELMLSGLVALMLLLVSSTFLYLLEAAEQPEAFGSIPRALWWSVATLTTVGYGDVTPISAAGRFFAGITAVAGIGLVAMPTGILAAAFSDAFQSQESKEASDGI